MSRPLSPTEALKHPRRVRRSSTKTNRLEGAVKPSKAIVKKWKPLADLCISLLVGQDRINNVAKKVKVRIKWSKAFPRPVGFPAGRYNIPEAADYSAELVLIFLYERFLCDHTPNMIYTNRQKYLSNLTRLTQFIEDADENIIS